MKYIVIISLLSFTLLLAVPTKQDINTLVEEIKPARLGLSHQKLSLLRNPFIKVKKGSKDLKQSISKSYSYSSHYRSRKVHFKLYATLNKSAKINNRWILLGQKLSGYRLKKITKLFVIMQKGDSKPVTVYLNSKNKKINLMTK